MSGPRRRARAGLGAPDAIAVRAGRNHARILDRADLARAAGRGPPGDPARPGPGVRHRDPPHDPHVPAMDCVARRRRRLRRVLDYGCGSGILAIGAAKFGAPHIDAVDIDEAAVEATRLNAAGERRAVSAPAFPTWHRDATTSCSRTSSPRRSRCWRRCCARMSRRAARLVLAGILERQADELKLAYAPYARLEVSDSEDGWILMTARSSLRDAAVGRQPTIGALMSLVTRCPACATTFKVVRDQLRISDGWVRCGRCSEVFDATIDLREARRRAGPTERARAG